MIAYLRGKILRKTIKGIILDTGNVGYFVHLPAPLLTEIEQKEDREFFIHSQIREDAFDLYGFVNPEDLDFFRNLISISGIGPKVAMEILSVPVGKIKAAIFNEDLEFMKKIRGVGPKSAKRIILEMKGKIVSEERDYKGILPEINEDAVEALLRLGYQKSQIIKTLRNLPEDLKKPEDAITYFLKNAM